MPREVCPTLLVATCLASAAFEPSASAASPAPDPGVVTIVEVVLYDQLDNPVAPAVQSQDYDPAHDALDKEAADDFVVPGPAWSISRIDVAGTAFVASAFHVSFYADAGSLPGTLVARRLTQPNTQGNASIALSPPVVLGPGSYWVSVQARMDFPSYWGWLTRAVQTRDGAAFRAAVDSACSTWGTLSTTCGLDSAAPDLLFRLSGSIVPGALIVNGETIGDTTQDFSATEAANLIDYAWKASQPAANDFLIVRAHDPWNDSVIATAIANAGHNYNEILPVGLFDYPWSDYRVIVLNWDDHTIDEFIIEYSAAIPSLENYVRDGGVVWIQGAIQSESIDFYPLPFGGGAVYDWQDTNYVADPANPIVAGLGGETVGNPASSASHGGLPAAAHVIKRALNANGEAVLSTLAALIFHDDFEAASTISWSATAP